MDKVNLPPSISVLYFFRHITDQVGMRVAATRPNMTPNEIMLILRLGEPLRMKALADALTCQPSNMTPLVVKCESKGWVQKVKSTTDARVTMVELTEAGKQLRTDLIEDITQKITEESGLSSETFAAIQTILNQSLKS